MNRDLLIVIIILIANLIVSLFYLLFHLRDESIKKGLIVFATFLVFPVVGFAYMGISELINLIVFRQKQKELRYDELSFGKKRMKLVQDTDVDKSLDNVSLEEALMLSNKKDRRQSLMEVLKQDDYINMIDNIKEAVSSDDKEVSHYAATFVTETIGRYKGRELELRKQMEKNPSPENLVSYTAYIREVLDSGLFEGLEKERFLAMYDAASWRLYQDASEQLSDSHVTALFRYFEKAGNREKMNDWLDVMKERSMESLECFKEYAAYCYEIQDKEEFFGVLDRVRYSNVVLDNESVEWIRFFA